MTPRRRRSGAQRGMSESVQWAVLTPVLLLAILGVVQAGVVLHARTVVRDAAAAVAQQQSRAGASPGEARAVAERVTAPADLEQLQVIVDDSGALVSVTVTGRAPVFFDVGLATVSATAVMPKEG